MGRNDVQSAPLERPGDSGLDPAVVEVLGRLVQDQLEGHPLALAYLHKAAGGPLGFPEALAVLAHIAAPGNARCCTTPSGCTHSPVPPVEAGRVHVETSRRQCQSAPSSPGAQKRPTTDAMAGRSWRAMWPSILRGVHHQVAPADVQVVGVCATLQGPDRLRVDLLGSPFRNNHWARCRRPLPTIGTDLALVVAQHGMDHGQLGARGS